MGFIRGEGSGFSMNGRHLDSFEMHKEEEKHVIEGWILKLHQCCDSITHVQSLLARPSFKGRPLFSPGRVLQRALEHNRRGEGLIRRRVAVIEGVTRRLM